MHTYHTKLTRKSERAVDSDRVLKFVSDKELHVISAVVQASMRDTSYKVQRYNASINSVYLKRILAVYHEFTMFKALDL